MCMCMLILGKEMATHSSILAWRIPMDGGTCQAIVHVIEELDTTEQVNTIHVKSQLKT